MALLQAAVECGSRRQFSSCDAGLTSVVAIIVQFLPESPFFVDAAELVAATAAAAVATTAASTTSRAAKTQFHRKFTQTRSLLLALSRLRQRTESKVIARKLLKTKHTHARTHSQNSLSSTVR